MNILIFADLLQVDETTCIKPACSSQLAASLLTTCNRLVIIKPEQSHVDIDLVTADLRVSGCVEVDMIYLPHPINSKSALLPFCHTVSPGKIL